MSRPTSWQGGGDSTCFSGTRGVSHVVLTLLVFVSDFLAAAACDCHHALLPACMHRGALSQICMLSLFLSALVLTLTLQEHIKNLVTRVATHVLDNGGIVRELNSWGTRTLPQRMRGVNQFHTIGECVVFTSRVGAPVMTFSQLLDNAIRRFP